MDYTLGIKFIYTFAYVYEINNQCMQKEYRTILNCINQNLNFANLLTHLTRSIKCLINN